MPKIRHGYLFLAIGCSITVTAMAEVTLTTVALPGGSSAVGSYTMASCYGQATAMTTASVGSATIDPGFLCVEATDFGIPGDLNGDGHVNGIDLAMVLSYWGPCAGSNCPADVDRNGVVNGADLAIVLGSWG